MVRPGRRAAVQGRRQRRPRNAENNLDLDRDTPPRWPRPTPTRARRSSASGLAPRAAPTGIRKRTSHITVEVESVPAKIAARRARRREGEGPLMGQKINPHGFRLGITILHRKVALVRGQAVRGVREGRRRDPHACSPRAWSGLGISKVEIERTRDRVRVDIDTAAPGHRDRPAGCRGGPDPRPAGEADEEAGPAQHPRGQEQPSRTRSSSRRASPSSRAIRAALRRDDAQGVSAAGDAQPAGRRGIRAQRSAAPGRRGDVALGVRPRGSGSRCTRCARTSTDGLVRGPHHLRPDRREGVDLQGRRRGRLAARACPAAPSADRCAAARASAAPPVGVPRAPRRAAPRPGGPPPSAPTPRTTAAASRPSRRTRLLRIVSGQQQPPGGEA